MQRFGRISIHNLGKLMELLAWKINMSLVAVEIELLNVHQHIRNLGWCARNILQSKSALTTKLFRGHL